jgi:epoxyqueuosine reductase
MKSLDQQFVQEMKEKLDVELAGVASIGASKELRDRATALLLEAKSAVVFGKEIYREIVRFFKSSKEAGEIESGELIGGHSDYLNGRLNTAVHKMSEILRKEGFRSLPLSAIGPVDQRFMTSLLSYKHTAELAGLGRIGRHSLLITPEFGPRVRLACLLTEAPLEHSTGRRTAAVVRPAFESARRKRFPFLERERLIL